jgi:hypothetical protein
VTQRLQQIPDVRLDPPAGAFYVMPEVSAFMGPGVEAAGWGPVPDVDALCRCGAAAANGAGGGRGVRPAAVYDESCPAVRAYNRVARLLTGAALNSSIITYSLQVSH